MQFSEYQKAALATAIYPVDARVFYPCLGLAGEVGEALNKIKKIYREHGGEFGPENTPAIADEIGDILWYVANLAQDLCLDLNEIAIANLQKLTARKLRGTLTGAGDSR